MSIEWSCLLFCHELLCRYVSQVGSVSVLLFPIIDCPVLLCRDFRISNVSLYAALQRHLLRAVASHCRSLFVEACHQKPLDESEHTDDGSLFDYVPPVPKVVRRYVCM